MKLVFTFLPLFFLSSSILCQGVDSSSSIQKEAGGVKYFDRPGAIEDPLSNGKEYIFYNLNMEGNPFLEKAEFTTGWIGYQGKLYDPVDMIYDISRDELVILRTNRAIVLHNEWVDSFYLSGHYFTRLGENQDQGIYRAGFYELLYRGKVQLIASRECHILDKIENSAVVRVFSPKDEYFIKKGGKYYPANNRKDLSRVFPDKKRELRKIIRRTHMRMQHQNFEQSLVKVTAFYDQLIQKE